ncbi:MAG: suppressor of fused domain protein [Inquilinus limosus]|uniref:Suppressor of fused domain protein n=1 Tax=Inquilinus limosus TaxID=171674 RepID=A0A952FVG7_9PROT|nr:suppressor of fused domain protein [Inquilinus limosus]
MSISAENKALHRYLSTLLGSGKVHRYWDEAEESSIDILEIKDVPAPKVTTWATIGLSDAQTGLTVTGVPLRVEFIFSSMTVNSRAPNILATCAFNVINSKMKSEPGVIYPRVIEMYYKNIDVAHVLLGNPYLWDMETQKFDTKVVAWLVAVPISGAEHAFADDKGVDHLERALEARKVDIFNLRRKSIF